MTFSNEDEVLNYLGSKVRLPGIGVALQPGMTWRRGKRGRCHGAPGRVRSGQRTRRTAQGLAVGGQEAQHGRGGARLCLPRRQGRAAAAREGASRSGPLSRGSARAQQLPGGAHVPGAQVLLPIWKDPVCGDGNCEWPWEFPAWGRFGCRAGARAQGEVDGLPRPPPRPLRTSTEQQAPRIGCVGAASFASAARARVFRLRSCAGAAQTAAPTPTRRPWWSTCAPTSPGTPPSPRACS